MEMIGMSCGAKNNKSIGFIKSIGFNPDPKLIIFAVGTNFAEKICSARILKDLNEHYKSKVVSMIDRKFNLVKLI